MAQASLQVQINVKEIYDQVCDPCKKIIENLVREKITAGMVRQVIGAKEG